MNHRAMLLDSHEYVETEVTLNDAQILANLDTGAFISSCTPRLAERLELIPVDVPTFTVTIANGEPHAISQKVLCNLKIKMKGPLHLASLYLIADQPVDLNLGKGYSIQAKSPRGWEFLSGMWASLDEVMEQIFQMG